MLNKYMEFLRGISMNTFGKLGVVFTSSAFASFIIFELARFAGLITNSYFGLITYMALPALFIIGLIMIPIGWLQYKKRQQLSGPELIDHAFEQGTHDTIKTLFKSKVLLTVATLTILNILFLTVIAAESLKFMESPVFCGTACHGTMYPEWVAYQNSPHARVKCVDCHIGEGAEAQFGAKINGLRQMVFASFGIQKRPIPTPVHTLSPSNETCEKCHWPEKFYGSRIKNIVRYDTDEESTPSYTTLLLHVNTKANVNNSGIHWHVKTENGMNYASVDDKHLEMIWVDVLQTDGSYKRYQNESLLDKQDTSTISRRLDCIDCHNRATHIFEDPSEAIDLKLETNIIDHSIPYIKNESLNAITAEYEDMDSALAGIENHILNYYKENYPEIYNSSVEKFDAIVKTLQETYSNNIFPVMNITWNTYPTHIGHKNEDGCLRCHNADLVDSEGNNIPDDCSLCHSLLAYEESEPFVIEQ